MKFQIKHIFTFTRKTLMLFRTFFYCCWLRISFDKTWSISGKLIIVRPNIFHKKSVIKIGKNFIAQADIRWNSFGIIQPNVLNVRTPGAQIIIGDNVGISGSTISASRSIVIGNNVLIGSGCVICDSDAHPIHPKDRNDNKRTKSIPIKIEDDVFIGARCLILKGVTIGKGSVIGAGSVVTHDVMPMSIYAGNPAKFIKKQNNLYE